MKMIWLYIKIIFKTIFFHIFNASQISHNNIKKSEFSKKDLIDNSTVIEDDKK
ncbi:hypothetical protein RRG49_04215 [Mycoplasmopsis felis]|uniref:hypothetical protein n=1 Tax=Mycoplasmopsis felis TaxID=33923 RepID=UPI002AFFD335|nr:hypothetical protein [Mycoplasmopsis felis]WQQ09419.1 hypothetical protein RRG41_00510 [Mycoplasmopsis felis]